MWDIPLESDSEDNLLSSEAYRKMDDVELVLRFFAYRFIDDFSGTVETFLDAYLKQANTFSEETNQELEKLFNDVVDIAYGLFGEKAFIPPIYERQVNKPQKTIYDPLMQSIAKHVELKDRLLAAKDINEVNRYANRSIKTDGIKLFDGRNTVPSAVKERVEFFDYLFQPYLT